MELLKITENITGQEAAAVINTNDESLSILADVVRGASLFTFLGYINSSGAYAPQDISSNNRATGFIPFTPENLLTATNLTRYGSIPQVSFYEEANEETFISFYNVAGVDGIADLALDDTITPAGTKYIRLNGTITLPHVLTYDGILSNKELQEIIQNPDQIITDAITRGEEIFTVTGYVNKNTGIVDPSAGYKSTEYVKIPVDRVLYGRNLAVAGAFRQAAFFTEKRADTIIGSYNVNDDPTVNFNAYNIPEAAQYARFTANAADPALISFDLDRLVPVAPFKAVSGAWQSIDPVTGYSANYGRYWDGTQWVYDNRFSGLVYQVVAGENMKVRGSFYGGNIPVVVFFSDAALTTHVANGAKLGTIKESFYLFDETVPAGATYAMVQQYRQTTTVQPFTEKVAVSAKKYAPKRIIIAADSFGGMLGYGYEEFITLVKREYPEYDIYNFAIGGERTVEIAARLGAFKMFITPTTGLATDAATGQQYVTLPAGTGTVSLGSNSIANSWNDLKLTLLYQTTCTLDCAPDLVMVDGIECLLTRSGTDYFLNRVSAGAGTHKIFDRTQIIPVNSIAPNPDDILICNMGQNGGWTIADANPAVSAALSADELVAQVTRLVEGLGVSKFIVLSSHWADLGASADALTSVTQRGVQEAKLQKKFGAYYFNARRYFGTRGVADALASGWWNTGTYPVNEVGQVYPTAADTAAMAAGGFAPMFLPNPTHIAPPDGDIIHLSRRSYLIKYAAIFNQMKALRFFE